jgi:hypothetical protein
MKAEKEIDQKTLLGNCKYAKLDDAKLVYACNFVPSPKRLYF